MAFSRGREKKCNSVFYVVTSVCSKQSGPTRHQTIFGVVSLSFFRRSHEYHSRVRSANDSFER